MMSKCWYCDNELASEDNLKHFGICSKCYDEMFKSVDTIIQSFTNKIADLEAKLAEKEKEIEQLKKFADLNKTSLTYLEQSSKSQTMLTVCLELLKQCKKNKTKQKTDFAIEQLEKVKEFFLKEHRDEEMDTDYLITKDAGEIADFLLNQIKQLKDQQIKELKEKK